MVMTGAQFPTLGMTIADANCLRCGTCCASAFLALSNVSIERDEQELARWLAYHGCEPMRYPGDKGDVLAVKIPIPCKHLASDPQSGKTSCLIYEKRPKVCREYLCKRTIEVAVQEAMRCMNVG